MNSCDASSVFWLFALGAFAYFAAAAASFAGLKRTGRSEGFWFRLLCLAGFAAQTAAFARAAQLSGRLPLGNSYELMEGVAWALMLANIFGFAFLRAKIAPTLAAVIVCALSALPLFCPAFADGALKAAPLNVNYAAVHAMLAVLAYAMLGFSFVFSLMHILHLRSLKMKEGGAVSRLLMPLPRLVSFARFFLCLACSLMALSLVIGAAAAAGLEMSAAYAVKFSIGALLFLLMLGLLAFSSRGNADPAGFSKMNVALFVFAVVLIVPISIRSLI